MSKPRLLFLDFPFHSQTRSSDFFLDVLARNYEVIHEFLEKDWNDIDGCVALVRRHQPDVVMTWQVCLRGEALVKLGIPVIWVPMLDNVSGNFDDRFVDPARVKEPLVTFCREHAATAAYWDLPYLPVCYFAEPAPTPDFSQGNNRVLLWYRGPVQPAELAPVLKGIPNLEVVVKHDPDPPYADVARVDGELAPFIKTVIQGFLPKEEYQTLVASCGIYVAPRKSEGIGLSFIEAMARGTLVVAYDAATMNEYVRHGETGWLFSESSAPALPMERVAGLRQASYQAAVAGYQAWLASQPKILEFVAAAKPLAWRTGLQPKLAAVRLLKRLKSGL